MINKALKGREILCATPLGLCLVFSPMRGGYDQREGERDHKVRRKTPQDYLALGLGRQGG